MGGRDPIEVIKELASTIDKLSGLKPDSPAFLQWQEETKAVLEMTFSAKSIHYQGFAALRFREVSASGFGSAEIDKINVARYRRDLEQARGILQKAIQELTLDRTLFRKIQTTPEAVEVPQTGEYFVSPSITDSAKLKAIHDAFKDTGMTFLGKDSASSKGSTLRERFDKIKQARIGVYDVSNWKNVDVFLEIGAAVALGKKTVIICSRDVSPPSAVREIGFYEYENDDQLTEIIREILKR